MVRLFVGGLAEDITSQELSQRFDPFGVVENCEVVPPKDNDTFRVTTAQCRGFGYLDLEPKDEASLRKCLSVYNGSKWRGGVLKVQPAKPHYANKLVAEWAQQREEAAALEEAQKKPPKAIGPSDLLTNPLVLLRPDGQEVETRPNQRKTFFPVVAPKPAIWESVPPTPGVLRKEAFVQRMEAEYDAEAAREAWRQSQKRVKKKEPRSSDELGAVDFADAADEVVDKAGDLSRFSDDDED